MRVLKLTAIVSALTLVALSGTASFAQEKERIGIDNVDKCDQSLRDPECTNDSLAGDRQRYVQKGTMDDDMNDGGDIRGEAQGSDMGGDGLPGGGTTDAD